MSEQIYKIPENIKKSIDKNFCIDFLLELHKIFGLCLTDSEDASYCFVEGTIGWDKALEITCEKLNKVDIYEYYKNLHWEDSDLFDSELTDELIRHKLILNEEFIEVLTKYNNDKTIDTCLICETDRFVEDMKPAVWDPAQNKWVEKSTDFDGYICKCEHSLPSTVKKDYEKIFKNELNLTKEEYFFCKNCNEYHRISHKGNEFCLFCETKDRIDSAFALK